MKRLTALILLPLAAACAATDPTEVRAPRSENEFVTGSRIPGKGRGAATTRDDIEHMRSTAQQPMPDTLKDAPR